MPYPPVQVHDLLCIGDRTALAGDGDRPDWVAAALDRAPWVVVRRREWRDGLIPVGIRGGRRDQRWAGWLPPAAVADRCQPERLPAAGAGLSATRRGAIPALGLLMPVAAVMAVAGWPWGPAGSVGFELATGVPAATAESDLDLIIRAPTRLSRLEARNLVAALTDRAARADALIEVPAGAVSLLDYAGNEGGIVLRTTIGPRLVADPWHPRGGSSVP